MINKSDLKKKYDKDSIKGNFLSKYLISTKNKKDVEDLIKYIVQNLPEHPPYYSKDELTDKNERFLVSEIVREKIFESFSQEIPYSTHVEVLFNDERYFKKEGNIYTRSTTTEVKEIYGKKDEILKNLVKNQEEKLKNYTIRSLY